MSSKSQPDAVNKNEYPRKHPEIGLSEYWSGARSIEMPVLKKGFAVRKQDPAA